MKKRIVIWALVVLVAAGAVVILPNLVQSSVPTVYYTTPTVKTYENVVNCTGTIQSENVYKVYASGSLVPSSIPVSLGDMVTEGQLLLEVDDAATERLNQNAVSDVIGEVSDSINTASPALDLSSLLSGSGLTDLLGGGLDLGGIAESIQSEDNGATESMAVLAGHEGGEITSPAFAMVTEIAAVPGSPITAGKHLFTLQDVKHYKVTASVSEGDIAKLQVGDKAVIRGTGFSGTSFNGVVSMIHPTAHKALNGGAADTVVDVEITVENPNNTLKPGFSAKVEITGGQSYELVTVPYEAIRQDEKNEEYVYIYENGTLRKSHIVTGRELTNVVEVLEGLSFDSIVVYNPDDVPGEGAVVNIRGRADTVAA